MNFTLNRPSVCLILFLVSFLLYGNTLAGGFVWDDHYIVEQNPYLKEASSIFGFFTKDCWENSRVSFQSGFYRPVMLLTYFVNYHVWGGQPFGFHLFNIMAHALNGILIFLILKRLTGNRMVPWLSALFFIAHPVQTEVVAFIADTGDIIVVLFLLLFIYSYLVFLGSKKNPAAVASAVFLFLALLSKENAMIGFALILLIDWFYISKFDRRIFKEKVPIFLMYFLITVFYIAIRINVLGKLNALTTLGHIRYVSVLPSFDFWSHILTTIKIVFLYVKLLVLPLKLTISYVVLPAISLFSAEVFFPAVFLASSGILIFICARENIRWLSFSLLWFFMTMLPVSNLIPISNTVAERFLYLPAIGYCFLMANCFYALATAQKQRLRLFAVYGSLMALVIFFSYKTVTRNLVWRSDFTLFSSALTTKPCAPLAHLNLSRYYNQKKDFRKGREHYHQYMACRVLIQEQYADLKKQAQ